MTPFITASQVAQIIGLADADAFLRRRANLELTAVFPLPMASSRRPMLWKRDAIQAWVDRQGLPQAPVLAQPTLGSNVVLLELARRA